MLLIVTDHENMYGLLEKNNCSYSNVICVEPKFNLASEWLQSALDMSVNRLVVLAYDTEFHDSLIRYSSDLKRYFDDVTVTLFDETNARSVWSVWDEEMQKEPELPACVTSVADVEKKDWTLVHGVKTGIREIDNLIGKMYDTQVSLIIGQAGQGKTTFANSIATHALHDGDEVFIYTGEMDEEDVRKDLENQSIFPSLLPFDGELSDEQIKARKPYERYQENNELVSNYMTERFCIDGHKAYVATAVSVAMNDKAYFTEVIGNTVLSLTRQMLECRPSIKLVILDNIMTAMDDLQEGDNEFVAQGNFMQQCCIIAKAYNVHICVICHVNKQSTTQEVLTKYSVSGSSKITNLASFIISFERGVDENNDDCSYLGIVKNRVGGKETKVSDRARIRYNPINRNYMVWNAFQSKYEWGERKYNDVNEEIRDLVDRSVMNYDRV